MVIILCECNWDIPRVEKLPAHQHITRQRLIHIPTGREIWAVMALEGDGWHIVEEREEIYISVNWKEVFHG